MIFRFGQKNNFAVLTGKHKFQFWRKTRFFDFYVVSDFDRVLAGKCDSLVLAGNTQFSGFGGKVRFFGFG